MYVLCGVRTVPQYVLYCLRVKPCPGCVQRFWGEDAGNARVCFVPRSKHKLQQSLAAEPCMQKEPKAEFCDGRLLIGSALDARRRPDLLHPHYCNPHTAAKAEIVPGGLRAGGALYAQSGGRDCEAGE
jgi:hypothetical protein